MVTDAEYLTGRRNVKGTPLRSGVEVLMGRLQRYLDVLTSVVTISTGIALIWVLAFASPRKTARPPDIKPGAVVQLPAGLASTHGANQTALVFIRSGCHFCSESMP